MKKLLVILIILAAGILLWRYNHVQICDQHNNVANSVLLDDTQEDIFGDEPIISEESIFDYIEDATPAAVLNQDQNGTPCEQQDDLSTVEVEYENVLPAEIINPANCETL